MTELERRALMGDFKAQEECTEKGIVLPCPWCKKTPKEDDVFPDYKGWIIYHDCKIAGHMRIKAKTRFDLILKWNTRTAPPVGKCGECKHWYKNHCATVVCATEETNANFYCSNFESKSGEQNEN